MHRAESSGTIRRHGIAETLGSSLDEVVHVLPRDRGHIPVPSSPSWSRPSQLEDSVYQSHQANTSRGSSEKRHEKNSDHSLPERAPAIKMSRRPPRSSRQPDSFHPSSHPSQPQETSAPPRSSRNVHSRRANASMPGLAAELLPSPKPPRSPRRHHQHGHSSFPQPEAKQLSKKKSKVKKSRSSLNRTRSHSSCGSSVSWSEFHVEGLTSPSERLTVNAELAVQKSPIVSPRLDKHIRTFATATEEDDTTVETDKTPRIKPARAPSSGEYRHGKNHPPTDLEFALGMDFAARKLKGIVKDQEEAVVRKKVDYDQLRDLLDAYSKDPKKADQDRLNQLLAAMGEAITASDEASCSSSIASSSSSPFALGGTPSTPTRNTLLVASEKEIYATLDLEKGGAVGKGGIGMHKKDILEACGEEAVEFVSVPRKSAMPRRGSYGSSHSRVLTKNYKTSDESLSSSARSGSSNSRYEAARLGMGGSARLPRSSSIASSTHSIVQDEKAIYAAIDLSEGSAILSETRAERNKKEVLEVFGDDVHGAEEFVAVLLKPAVSRRRLGGTQAEEPANESDSHPRSRSIGNNQERKPHGCPCSPLLIPRVFKRVTRGHSRQRQGVSN